MPVPPATSSQAAAFSAALDDFMRAVRRAQGRFGNEPGLTLSQFHLVEPLAAAPDGLGIGELATAAGVSAPTATRMLVRLERDGVVERATVAGDRRCVRVALTDAGGTQLASKRAMIEERRQALFATLTETERRSAPQLLARLAAGIEELR